VEVPKASWDCSDCISAWLAGQKKKTQMTANCGSNKAHGSQPERKTTRFSMGFQRKRRPGKRPGGGAV
jgi:hypothetical protein